MDLDELKKHWNTFAKTDPYWAILTDPLKKDGKWNIEEFFKTGEEHINSIIEYVDSLNLKIQKDRALDFGCGAGRLTQALCTFFDECIGIDIAPAMIELANACNRYAERCKYYVNTKSDLTIFQSNYFDFIYTCLVLQHIEPHYVKEYLKEFFRVISPGGVIIFHLPSRKLEQHVPQTHDKKADKYFLHCRLPDSGFRAKITLPNSLLILNAGSEVTINVMLRNTSDVVWPSSNDAGMYQVHLGNHWLAQDQKLLLTDDGRAPLPHALKPREEIELPITVRVPLEEGLYVLELDMVQEYVAWFHDRGSETVKTFVQVRKAQLNPVLSFKGNITMLENNTAHTHDEQSKVLIPIMEMHGIAQAEVIALIEANGGKVIDIQEDQSAGRDWESFRYCVLKQ